MEMDRRTMMGAGLALMISGLAEAQSKGETLSESKVFHYDKLRAKPNAAGGDARAVTEGVLPTGEPVEMHMTSIGPGKMPHPPHKHRNSEFVMIREGEVEYMTDGLVERCGPGDVIFTASMKPHGMRNVGTTMARYFVVSVGPKGGNEEVTLLPVRS